MEPNNAKILTFSEDYYSTTFDWLGNYIVDYYVKALGLIVEIDGIGHENKIEFDAARQVFLESLGL